MARRTAQQAEALREAITREALAQFAAKGMEATSVGDIAKAVGISKQALMHHFRTKDALLQAIEDHQRAVTLELLPHLVEAFTAPDTELDDVITKMMEQIRKHRDVSKMLLRRVAFGADMPQHDGKRAIHLLLIDYIRRGQENGTLRKDFVPEDALFSLGMMFLTCVVAMDNPGIDGSRSPEQLVLQRNRELIRIARLALLEDPATATSMQKTGDAPWE